MISTRRKQNSKSKVLKNSEGAGKNCSAKAKMMSPMARLMATFYGIDSK